MAAISANGARELVRFERQFQGDLGGTPQQWKSTLVLTSDGRILWKTDDSGYTLQAKVNSKLHTTDELIGLARKYAANRGYVEVRRSA